mmetsp:Transcript_10535/g.23716  ORF Transcript_10535/g.23716 Transcript_10535/m.23716 type:complete len:212 (+) Transcript_10535:1109-1744(+)
MLAQQLFGSSGTLSTTTSASSSTLVSTRSKCATRRLRAMSPASARSRPRRKRSRQQSLSSWGALLASQATRTSSCKPRPWACRHRSSSPHRSTSSSSLAGDSVLVALGEPWRCNSSAAWRSRCVAWPRCGCAPMSWRFRIRLRATSRDGPSHCGIWPGLRRLRTATETSTSRAHFGRGSRSQASPRPCMWMTGRWTGPRHWPLLTRREGSS